MEMKKTQLGLTLFVIVIFFLSCGNTSESTKSETIPSNPSRPEQSKSLDKTNNSEKSQSLIEFCKNLAQERVSNSDGYFRYADIEFDEGQSKGYLEEDKNGSGNLTEFWEIPFKLKVECLKDGGDIQLSDGIWITSLDVKMKDYANATTKKGEFYKMFGQFYVIKQGDKWVEKTKE